MAVKKQPIEERETPISAPVSFVIMLIADSTSKAIEIYDDLIARGVQPKAIQANIQQRSASNVVRTTSPMPSGGPYVKGEWEIKYNEAFGSKMVCKDYIKTALAKAGYDASTREGCAQAMYELRQAGRMEKLRAPLNGWKIDGVTYSTRGSDEESDAPTLGVNAEEFDPDECV
jgi:hypothetical protein